MQNTVIVWKCAVQTRLQLRMLTELLQCYMVEHNCYNATWLSICVDYMFYCYDSVRLSAQLKCYCAFFGQLAIYDNGDCFCLM